MRAFKEPNLSYGWKCPICNTNKKDEVVLIGVEGTQEGFNMVAEQFHLKCIDLIYNKSMGVVYQQVEDL